MKLKACRVLPTAPIVGTWFRAVRLRHLKTALQTSHSATTPSRYSAGLGQYEILYLGEDFATIVYEVQAQLGSPHGTNTASTVADNNWANIQVEVRLSTVVDLCDASVQRRLGTTTQELTGNWDGYHFRGDGPAPTHKLGSELFNCGSIEGFISYSARVPTKKVLIVFPQRLLNSSHLLFSYHDGKRPVTHRIP